MCPEFYEIPFSGSGDICLFIGDRHTKILTYNYRPIALLPVLSKVFEKVLNSQLNAKLDEYHLVDNDQYVFRGNHSTEDAVIKFVDYIEKALTKNKFVISIHIDVSKALDSCNHDIMKEKLKRIGLNAISLQLMTSYMKDRVQEVWVDEL